MKAKKAKSKKVKQAVTQENVKPVVGQVVDPVAEPVEQAVAGVKPVCEPKEIIVEPMTNKDKVMVVLYSVLLFLAMTVQTGQMTMVLIGLALVLSIGKTPMKNLRAHLCVPVIGLILFAIMNGFAALYSNFGDTAAAELYKIMASFSMAVILLVRFEKKHVRGLLWGFATVCAVIALLCIDVGSWRKLFEAFNAVMNWLGADYSSVVENSQALRVNGIYNDANLTGALLGPAIFVALYLAHTAEKQKDRFFALLLLGVSAVSFLVAVSRAAILIFGITALIYLAIEGRKTRTELFFLMLCAGGAGVCFGILAILNMSDGSVVPVGLAFAGGVMAFLTDWTVGRKVSKRLRGHGKTIAVVCGGLAVLVLCSTIYFFRATEPFDFSEKETFYRGVALSPGNYTIQSEWDGTGKITVLIHGQTEEQMLVGERTELYNGPLETVNFIAPAGTEWATVRFFGENDNVLKKAVLSDGTEVPLKYKMLPDMISSRLQDGFLKSGSFQKRIQLYVNGLTLFREKSVLGHGLGSTEHLLTSVQTLHYESLYIHNHIIQVMDEMGVIGLVMFLMILLGTLLLLIRRRIEERDSLAVMLIACWFVVNLHSLVEINFSIRMFQCAAYFLLMIPAILYARPVAQKWIKQSGYVVLAVLWIQLAGFGFLLHSHRTVEREAAIFTTGDAVEFMETMKDFARRDPFDKEQYQLNFVGNAFLFEDGRYNATVSKYVDELRDSGTYAACSGLARYYYLPMGNFEELFASSRQGIAQVASESDAWNLQLNFYRNEVLPVMGEENIDVFLSGVLDLTNYLDRYNANRVEEIVLTEDNRAFLNVVASIVEAGVPNEAAYLIMTSQIAQSA